MARGKDAQPYTTVQLKKRYIEARGTGLSISASAIKAGVGRQTVYDWRRDDAAFAAEEQSAFEQGLDQLEDEAYRRAYEGCDKPVYFKGDEVGAVREYSDTLMIFLLKAGRPDKYRERAEVRHSGTVEHTVTLADLRAAVDAESN